MPLAGLFDCFANTDTLILACCFPCVLFGNTAAKVGQTTCLKGTLAMGVPCLNFYCLCQNRKLVREANGVEGNACSDCCTLYWCGFCALIQQANTVGAVTSLGDAFKIDRE